jgi:hypothetical protein
VSVCRYVRCIDRGQLRRKPGEVGASHGAEAGKAEVLTVNGPLIVKVFWASGCTVHWIKQSAAIADRRRGVCGVAFRNAEYPDLIVLVPRAIPPARPPQPSSLRRSCSLRIIANIGPSRVLSTVTA